MKYSSFLLSLFVLAVMVNASAQIQTRLYLSLPDYCPVPDNMAVAPDGSLTLTCPNFNSNAEGLIVRISKEKEVTELARIPGKGALANGRPMGLDYAPDGSLYVCNSTRGEVQRIVFKDGVVDSIQTVARGLSPNGLKYHDGYVYVTQPKMTAGTTAECLVSGLYRFSVSDREVMVTGQLDDPYLIFTAETTNPQRMVGLDGLAFDKDGNLYVAEFGDATIYRLVMNDDGMVRSSVVYAQLPQQTGIDGMLVGVDDNLYVTGFSQNQLWRVRPDQSLEILVQYPDNDGANGELDQPVDLCFFDGKLLITNFDLMTVPGMVNQSRGKPHTLSYIDLSDLW